MYQQQPIVVEFDGRATITDLNQFPRIFWLQNGSTAVPCVKVVGIDQIEVLIVCATNHGSATIDLSGKQGHTRVARRRSAERNHPDRSKVRRFEQLRADRTAAIGSVGCIEGFSSIVVEFNETSVLDAVCLGIGDRKYDPFAQFFFWPKVDFNLVAMVPGRSASNLWDRCETNGRIDPNAAVRIDGAGPECQR